MNSTQVQCFLCVAETRSFTKAASALFMTEQPVRRNVALLEEELGTPLFDRTTSPVTLTPMGAQYKIILSTFNRQMLQLKEELTVHQQKVRKRFRLGIPQWMDPFTLRTLTAQFRRMYPSTSLDVLQLDNGTLFRALQAGKVDAAFFALGQWPQSREMQSRCITEAQYCLYMPEDVLTDLSPETIERCWGLPLLIAPSDEYSFLERMQIGEQRQAQFGLHPVRIITPHNQHSLEISMRFCRFVTVGDNRFCALRQIPGLGCYPLPMQKHLMMVYPSIQPHPLLDEFASLAERVMAADKQDA